MTCYIMKNRRWGGGDFFFRDTDFSDSQKWVVFIYSLAIFFESKADFTTYDSSSAKLVTRGKLETISDLVLHTVRVNCAL